MQVRKAAFQADNAGSIPALPTSIHITDLKWGYRTEASGRFVMCEVNGLIFRKDFYVGGSTDDRMYMHGKALNKLLFKVALTAIGAEAKGEQSDCRSDEEGSSPSGSAI